jgi:hypothetical protein
VLNRMPVLLRVHRRRERLPQRQAQVRGTTDQMNRPPPMQPQSIASGRQESTLVFANRTPQARRGPWCLAPERPGQRWHIPGKDQGFHGRHTPIQGHSNAGGRSEALRADQCYGGACGDRNRSVCSTKRSARSSHHCAGFRLPVIRKKRRVPFWSGRSSWRPKGTRGSRIPRATSGCGSAKEQWIEQVSKPILVVEDEQEVRSLLRGILSQAGFEASLPKTE